MRKALGLAGKLAVVVSLVAVFAQPARSNTKAQPPARPADSFTDPLMRTLAGILAPVTPVDDAVRPEAKGIRVGLVSSGVDTAAFPQALRSQIYQPTADDVGYGTYAASVILQVARDARITVLDAFPGKSFDAGAQAAALDWAVAHASDLDVVLYAVPPQEFLDPISALQSSGRWNEVSEAIASNPVHTDRGELFGAAMDASLRAKQATGSERRALDAFSAETARWNRAADQVTRLNAAGVSVVAPAGDLGPRPQSILGFGNLPGVISVGGGSKNGVSAQSGAGPSIDGRVKPDLIAPTGIAALFPEKSVLAEKLRDLLDPRLKLDWDAGDPPSRARARLDSTFTSATIVAAATGGLRAQGISDAAVQRGALIAASVPLAGVPAWRQGAGLLRGVPNAAFARSRALAMSNADLGVQPADGGWTTWTKFVQGSPTAARTTIDTFIGTAPDGRAYTKAPSSAPPVGASAGPDGVRLEVGLGKGSWEGGVFCGFTQVSIPATSGSAGPTIRIEGVPDGVEQLPTCLIKGSQLVAHGFYIHDMPAENLTFALSPTLPEGASIIEKPLEILPVNPLHTTIYQRSTGADGNAVFPNIVPGYYTIRLFSDYGAPVSQTLADSSVAKDVLRLSELGENPSYLGFDALVLSATGWTEKDLRDRFGDDNVSKDKPTGGYLVNVGGRTIRIVLGFLQDKPGTAVTSRYIDLLDYSDLDFSAKALTDVLGLGVLGGLPVASDMRAWTFDKAGDAANGVAAQLHPAAALGAEGSLLGAGVYRFNLTTPNYKAHMSLNFSYELQNAFVLAVVRVGDETAAGLVTPWGTVGTPTTGPFTPPGQGAVGIDRADGLANFEFELKPKGASTGTLTFVVIPSRPVQQLAAPLSTARISDMSFALDTWQRIQWPGQMTPHGMGHLFDFNPNYSAKQMSAGSCRAIDSGGVKANVCEDWRVMVQSPLDDAVTVELVDSKGSVNPSIKTSGTKYADPKRGTIAFTGMLGFELPKAGGLEALTKLLPMDMKTNGRFWEQLALTRDVLAAHPGTIQVQIVDNVAGRGSGLVQHITGPVPVAPYVPFAAGRTSVI
jgi:hypothetical protein